MGCATFALLLALIVGAIAQDVDYCNATLCSRGRRHVACGHNGQFAANCNGVMINLQGYVSLILRHHNEGRNMIASGQLSPFSSAAQMASMTWDAELAKLAAYNAFGCQFEHDECRNTLAYRYSGQNLGIHYTRAINIASFLRQHLNSWFEEYRDANQQDVELYRVRTSGGQIGHFTLMVNERNDRVGCAVSQFTNAGGISGTLLVCNYAVNNMLDSPVYRHGVTASECRRGRNPNYRNLCSASEQYDHNNW